MVIHISENIAMSCNTGPYSVWHDNRIGNGKQQIMNCIEIIEIRLSSSINDILEQEIEKTINEIMGKESAYGIRFFKQVLIKADYMLLIFHSESISNPKGSEIGQLLQEALKEFGMVHHSLWNELDSIKPNNQKAK